PPVLHLFSKKLTHRPLAPIIKALSPGSGAMRREISMRHLGTQVLETERLILRPMTTGDAIPMFETWANDPQVTRFLRWEPHKDWLETAQLLAAWEALYQNPDYYQWAV